VSWLSPLCNCDNIYRDIHKLPGFDSRVNIIVIAILFFVVFSLHFTRTGAQNDRTPE
jgi:hypothetical protein